MNIDIIIIKRNMFDFPRKIIRIIGRILIMGLIIILIGSRWAMP